MTKYSVSVSCCIQTRLYLHVNFKYHNALNPATLKFNINKSIKTKYNNIIYHIYIAPFSNLCSFNGTLQLYYPAHWVIRKSVIYTLALRPAWLIDSHPHRYSFYTWVTWGTCGISSMALNIRWSGRELNPGPLDPAVRDLPLDHRMACHSILGYYFLVFFSVSKVFY